MPTPVPAATRPQREESPVSAPLHRILSLGAGVQSTTLFLMAPDGNLMNEVQLGEPVVDDERLGTSLKLAPLYYGMERVMRFCLLRFIHLHGVRIDGRLDGPAPSSRAAHEEETEAGGSDR